MISCRADGSAVVPVRISDSELDLPRDRPSAARLSQRAALPASRQAQVGALVPVHPRPARLQQAPARFGPAVPGGDRAPCSAFTLLLRSPAPARLDAGAVRGLARTVRRSRLAGSPATATVARTIATSGASGFISCARRTGCRSASSSLPPTPPSVWSRPSFSSARSNRDRRSSATRALPGGSSSGSWSRSSAHPASRPAQRAGPLGSLGGVRQWVEPAFDTLKDQLSLERHGGRTLAGLVSRVARRLLALAAAILHNWSIGEPGRSLVAYD